MGSLAGWKKFIFKKLLLTPLHSCCSGEESQKLSWSQHGGKGKKKPHSEAFIFL
jgi:hypothetical protein